MSIYKQMKKLIRSFGFAFKGLAYAAKTQLNFRIHLVATLIAVFMGCTLHIALNEWLWIALCVALVLITELLNTSLEFLTDLVSPDYNELAVHFRNMAAG